MTREEIVQAKLWEFNVGWLGLALAQATQFLLVQGLKSLTGKPRPDLLARCQPDLDNVQKHIVGGYGQDVATRWVLVSHEICMQPSKSVLMDGFRSFPSGHNSSKSVFTSNTLLIVSCLCGNALPITVSSHKIRHQLPTANSRVEINQ